jgi:hypothetical protein
MAQDLSFRIPPTIAVSIGSVVPDPGGVSAKGTQAWSTTTSTMVVWNGTQWGAASGGSGTQTLFIQNPAPTPPGVPYMWVQTGLGTSGTDLTFWIEDGS